MTPQEAQDIMKPFYPNDPTLAMKAMNTALGGNVPDWVLDSIVMSFFTFLQIKEIQEKFEHLNKDPFGLATMPYILSVDDLAGLN